MEFEDSSKVDSKDTEIKYDGFRVVVDPKSLMFVYGMTLNYRSFSSLIRTSTCVYF